MVFDFFINFFKLWVLAINDVSTSFLEHLEKLLIFECEVNIRYLQVGIFLYDFFTLVKSIKKLSAQIPLEVQKNGVLLALHRATVKLFVVLMDVFVCSPLQVWNLHFGCEVTSCDSVEVPNRKVKFWLALDVG